jgi:SAM-dependent methyltransferase
MTEGVRPCPLCGATDARLFVQTNTESRAGDRYSVVTCTACRLKYTRPLPDAEELATLYLDNSYVTRDSRQPVVDGLRSLFQRTIFLRQRQALLGRPASWILNVGCGNGEWLAALRKRGWDAYSTDLSPAAITLARAKGLNAYQGDLVSAAFPDGFFDVVTLWHVLEHVPDPKAEILEAAWILKGGGLLVVEVPNGDSLTLSIFRGYWYHLDIPRHLQFFGPRSLERLVTKAGFSPSQWQHFHHWDFTSVFYTVMKRLMPRRQEEIDSFSRGFKRASARSRAIFSMVGAPVALVSLIYSLVVTAMTGRGETITLTAEKAKSAREQASETDGSL